MIDTNVGGRLERMDLKARHCLSPLFEAVSNSIQSIQASNRHDGVVTVTLYRETPQRRLAIDAERSEPITTVEIQDNGVGFTDENMAAFVELDTRYKIRLGGKGVGRLTWLKVFDRAHVESVYQSDTGPRRRAFDFTVAGG